jgi:hypothetical protein
VSSVVNFSPLVKCARDSSVRTVNSHALTNLEIFSRKIIKLEMMAEIMGRL